MSGQIVDLEIERAVRAQQVEQSRELETTHRLLDAAAAAHEAVESDNPSEMIGSLAVAACVIGDANGITRDDLADAVAGMIRDFPATNIGGD